MAKAVLHARADLDSSGSQRGIAQMGQGVERFKNNQIKQIGSMIGAGFAIGAVMNFGKETMKLADGLHSMSINLGIGVEQLQALNHLAEKNGSSIGAMESVLKRAAIEGVKLEDVAKVMRGISVEGVSADQALRVAGQQGAELNKVFNVIANEGLDNVTNRLRDMNMIMAADMVNAIDALEDTFSDAMKSMTTTLQNWLGAFIKGVKEASAVLGALSAGESFKEALATGRSSVQAELAKPREIGAGLSRSDIAKQKAARVTDLSGVTVSAPQSADTLAKIGGIMGMQTDINRQREERVLKIQELIEKHNQKQTEQLNEIARNTSILTE